MCWWAAINYVRMCGAFITRHFHHYCFNDIQRERVSLFLSVYSSFWCSYRSVGNSLEAGFDKQLKFHISLLLVSSLCDFTAHWAEGSGMSCFQSGSFGMALICSSSDIRPVPDFMDVKYRCCRTGSLSSPGALGAGRQVSKREAGMLLWVVSRALMSEERWAFCGILFPSASHVTVALRRAAGRMDLYTPFKNGNNVFPTVQ